MTRPILYVLAGVNGAGKSSLGGHALRQAGLDWFNPDTFTRQLVETTGSPLADANAAAWREGMRLLDAAIANGYDHAFATTLGGATIAATLRKATASHDVLIWYCGLDSPESHLARIKLRVSRGGHDIPEAKVRERYIASIRNLIGLLPHLAQLQVFDNSADAPPGTPITDPRLLLQMERGRITHPTLVEDLFHIPDWARPIMEMALSMQA